MNVDGVSENQIHFLKTAKESGNDVEPIGKLAGASLAVDIFNELIRDGTLSLEDLFTHKNVTISCTIVPHPVSITCGEDVSGVYPERNYDRPTLLKDVSVTYSTTSNFNNPFGGGMSVTREQMLKDCTDYLESCGVDLDDVIDDKDTLIEDWVVDHSTVSLASLVAAADREGVDLEDVIVTVDTKNDWDGYPETVVEIRHASSSKGNTEEQLREVLDYIYWHIGQPFYGEYKAAFKFLESVK